jgi:hypothetical protein
MVRHTQTHIKKHTDMHTHKDAHINASTHTHERNEYMVCYNFMLRYLFSDCIIIVSFKPENEFLLEFFNFKCEPSILLLAGFEYYLFFCCVIIIFIQLEYIQNKLF